MLSGKDLSEICRLFKTENFKEVKYPEDFIKDVLRCDAPAQELGQDTLVLKAPAGRWGHIRLSNNKYERMDLARDWYKQLSRTLYASVDIVIPPKLRSHLSNLLLHELSDEEILRVTQYFCKIITNKYLPSFEPSFMVWHLDQVDYDGFTTKNVAHIPIHAHFVFVRTTKRISSEERALLDKYAKK